jgi:hypothetical protein
MPFLLAFWKPIAAIVLVIALVAAVGIAKHSYDERRRDEGRAEIQASWDAAKAAQKARELVAAKEADDYQRRVDAKRQLDFDKLSKRTVELENRLAAVPVGPDLVGELQHAVDTANDKSAGKPAENPAATTGLALSNWFNQVAKQYRECRETVIGWIEWDDRRIAP